MEEIASSSVIISVVNYVPIQTKPAVRQRPLSILKKSVENGGLRKSAMQNTYIWVFTLHHVIHITFFLSQKIVLHS